MGTKTKPKKNRKYIKHTYWMTKGEKDRLLSDMVSRNIKVRWAKGIVCTPLDEINRISVVAPEIWSGSCARQGSWYRASDKNGLYLVISAFELKGFENQKSTTLTRSDFKPPTLATARDKEEMVEDPDFVKKIPLQWSEIDQRDKNIYLRWARRLGSDVNDYDFLYLSHTANHANFIHPRFFIQENGAKIPYSIDRSAHLCSCCVELFQILGSEYPKKLVAPCPGAAIFARLKPDQYLLVENARF